MRAQVRLTESSTLIIALDEFGNSRYDSQHRDKAERVLIASFIDGQYFWNRSLLLMIRTDSTNDDLTRAQVLLEELNASC
jgi:hypothetical protein